MKYSPLDAEHRRLGAKMVEFGGWEMPVSYPLGTLAEHRACREGAAMFDVSHLGTVRVSGPEAFATLQRTLTNDLAKVAPGRAQYTHLLADDASVLDDIIIWWIGEDQFDVMPNASNTSRVVGAIGGIDTTSTRAVIAVQGPHARTVVARISQDAARVRRFHVQGVDIDGVPCVVAGTGYTGEDGVEIAVPVTDAPALWRRLEDAGAVPAGLGARDTLRLEAALPLHGHELGPGITPLQAGLGWVVAWSKPDFSGREALLSEKENGPRRRLVGIRIEGRRPARDGCAVMSPDGRGIGVVTSGNFSPTLGCCIALALTEPGVEPGQQVDVDVRGTMIRATVVETPFVRKAS